jgi:hypothetical protein
MNLLIHRKQVILPFRIMVTLVRLRTHCECEGFHGKHRWIAKTDLTPVPLDKSAIQSVTPSQIYAWGGIAPDVDIMGMVEARMPSEEKWYALTGRVVDAKVEADGDIHLALEDRCGSSRSGPRSLPGR